MNETQIFSNPAFGQVRVSVDTSNQPIFCLADICGVLGVSNVGNVKSRLDVDDIRQADSIDSIGRTQKILYVTEEGFYDVVIRSDSPKAKPFRKWVTHEVLPSIRKTGQYNANATSATLNEQLQANLTFADWAIKTLNINEASKLGWAKKISDKFGLAAELPNAVNAGTEKPITHAATDLLKSHNVGISAQAFNRMLELKGVVKHATRPGKRGKVHSWYVITPAFDKYGQNINATLLQNVEQPKLAKTLIKLREVYVDFMSEVDRAKEEYGVLVNDRIDDKFASQYNVMSTLISNTLAKIMDYEVNEAIKD